jgi:hypothetical protein
MKTERKALTFDPDEADAPEAISQTPRPVARTRRKPPPPEQRQQLGARVTTSTYRQLKARAALQGVTVATLVEQAIAEFLTNHPN